MARILIVDDEHNIRLMLRLGLQNAGHEVTTVADGAEALSEFGDGTSWEMVLLDQRMPGMEGIEVLREMRARNTETKIIMITAFGTIDLATNAMRAGATGFLRKPFTLDVLRDVVQAALENAPANVSPEASLPVSLSFSAAAINGFRINSGCDLETPKSENDEIRHAFEVRGPNGLTQSCIVVLPRYLLELVKAHTDHEEIPDAEHFWLWLCEESLANYLWQHAQLPPGGVLQIDELSTGLRRWVDAVLTRQ